MARPNPPDDMLIRAWELRGQGRTLKVIAQALTAEFGERYGGPISIELSRTWIPKGAALMITEDTRRIERFRALADCDTIRSWVQDMYDQGASALELKDLATIMHANITLRTRLLGLSRLPKASRPKGTDSDPIPDEATRKAIAEAIDQYDQENE